MENSHWLTVQETRAMLSSRLAPNITSPLMHSMITEVFFFFLVYW